MFNNTLYTSLVQLYILQPFSSYLKETTMLQIIDMICRMWKNSRATRSDVILLPSVLTRPISIYFGVRDWCPILFTIARLWGKTSCLRKHTWKCCVFSSRVFPFFAFFGLVFRLQLLVTIVKYRGQ